MTWWDRFLQFVDLVGLPLALFAVTIIVVLLIVRSERKDTSASIKVVNDITLANHGALSKLQKDHRTLLYKYGKLGQALTSSESALRLFNETYQNDKEEWERQRELLQQRIDEMTRQIEQLRNELNLRNQEILVLKKAK